MRQRYRLKIVPPAIGGLPGQILRLFPNALTFVGYPTDDQLAALAVVSGFLSSFGVSIEVSQA